MMAWTPRAGSTSEHVVHDRHYVRETLPRTGAGRQYVRPPLGGLQNRVALVPVQEELLAAVVRIRLADPEDPRAFPVKDPSATRSSIVPPGLNVGFSCSSGCGQNPSPARWLSTNCLMRESPILMKLRV